MANRYNRRNPLGDDQAAEDALNTTLGAVENRFGAAWLGGKGTHPLQILWQRRDPLATIELHTLGDSILQLSQRDPRWTSRQASIAKSDDVPNRRGAFFEIMGLGSLASGPQVLTPAAENQPGYDGIATPRPAHDVRLSLKSYGMSVHESRVQERVREFRALLQKAAIGARATDLHVAALVDRYPTAEDWSDLCASIPMILASAKRSVMHGVGHWSIWASPMQPPASGEFHPRRYSDHVIVAAPLHANEHENLWSKLEDAFLNMLKHAGGGNSNAVNVVLIHLPPIAPMGACIEWAVEFFERRPEKDLSGVIFYQPSVCRTDQNQSQLVHVLGGAIHPHNSKWFTFSSLNFVVPVGVTSTTPSTFKLASPEGEIILDRHYVYQAGDVYLLHRGGASGVTADISSTHAGVHTHAIIDVFGNGQEMQLSGIFAPSDDLLIV